MKTPFRRLMISACVGWSVALVSASPALSAAAPVSDSAAGSPIVIGSSFRLRSAVLRDERTINVYLPPDYGKSDRRFPVLYLLDGGVDEDFLHIAGLAQITSAYGAGQELIVVGIAGVDRRHDLTTPSSVPADLKVAPTSGGAAAYRRFLVEELKPWVAAHYRTDGRSALIGESLAGLFVLQSFLDEPQSFSDYIAISPSLWWNGGQAAASAEADLRRSGYSGQRLYVAFDQPPPPASAAAKDRALQTKLEAAFRRAAPKRLSWTIVHSREGHGTIYHPAALQALRTLYAIPPVPHG